MADGSRDVNSNINPDALLLPDEAWAYGGYIGNRKHSHDDDDGSFRFSPPLYQQRYSRVLDELKKDLDCVDKIVDFGCAEGKFLERARRSLDGRNFLMIGVDICEDSLKVAKAELEPDDPWGYFDDYNCSAPHTTYLFKGSIAEYDDRLENVDAVVAIELIEHLYEDVLQNGVDMIFSRMKPYLILFTTPNVEFNVLFNMGERKFRHDDHKFEWTCKEFQTWCQAIIRKYPDYQVQFSGIGEGPAETAEKIGCASQMAAFRRKNKSKYLVWKEERIKRIRAMAKNRHAIVKHWMSPAAGQGAVAKVSWPCDLYARALRRQASYEILVHCRQVYGQRLEEYNREPLSERGSMIVFEVDTGIKSTWFNLDELLVLPLVANVCKTASEITSLVVGNEYFIIDAQGFNTICTRVRYRDETDVSNYNSTNSYDDDDDEWQYDGNETGGFAEDETKATGDECTEA